MSHSFLGLFCIAVCAMVASCAHVEEVKSDSVGVIDPAVAESVRAELDMGALTDQAARMAWRKAMRKVVEEQVRLGVTNETEIREIVMVQTKPEWLAARTEFIAWCRAMTAAGFPAALALDDESRLLAEQLRTSIEPHNEALFDQYCDNLIRAAMHDAEEVVGEGGAE